MKQEIRYRKSSLCQKQMCLNHTLRVPHLFYHDRSDYRNKKHQSSLFLQVNQQQNIYKKCGSVRSIINSKLSSISKPTSQLSISLRNELTTIKNTNSIKFIQISKLQNISLHNTLFLISKIIEQCQKYQLNFGYSYFQLQNYAISTQGILILNQKHPTPHPNNPNYLLKIQDETQIVQKIMETISKLSAPKIFNDFYLYYERNKIKNKCNYKYMKSLIKSYCFCTKIKLKSIFDVCQIIPKQIKNKKSYIAIIRQQRTVSSINQSKQSNNKTINHPSNKSIGKYLNIINNKNHNKLQSSKRLKSVKKSMQVEKSKRLFLRKKMAKSNQISIQFNVKISSNNAQNFKNCLESSNLKISDNDQIDQQSLTQRTNCNKYQKYVINYKKQHKNSQQIQSINSQYKSTSYQTNIQQNLKNRNEQLYSNQDKFEQQQKIYKTNNWIRQVDNLQFINKPMIQSFIEGKQQQIIHEQNPQYLGKLARTVVQSYISEGNQINNF